MKPDIRKQSYLGSEAMRVTGKSGGVHIWIMSTARSVHGPDQTTFSRILQTQGGDQVLAGTPLRRVAETLDIAESLLGKWKRQYEQQGDDAFPGNGKQRGESAELRRLRQQLAQVTMERDVLKKALAIFSQPTK